MGRVAVRCHLPGPAKEAHLIGEDPKIEAILELVDQVAGTNATVLITGETGTGKDVIARLLHQRSGRREAPFIALNCGAVADSLMESELFGHAKGAFTGADAPRHGKFEAADGGTIFLDELAEMRPALQICLLRLLQSGEYIPVGEARPRYCDVRVIAATNHDLAPLMEVGRFRHDLYYRLNIIRIDVPPLRDRPGDIPRLAEHFLRRFAGEYGKPDLAFSSETVEQLRGYSYPGNVRELENAIRRAVILARQDLVTPSLFPPEFRSEATAPVPEQGLNFHAAREVAIRSFEQAYLANALRACGGIISRAARKTGLSERNFYKKLALYGIDYRTYRG